MMLALATIACLAFATPPSRGRIVYTVQNTQYMYRVLNMIYMIFHYGL